MGDRNNRTVMQVLVLCLLSFCVASGLAKTGDYNVYIRSALLRGNLANVKYVEDFANENSNAYKEVNDNWINKLYSNNSNTAPLYLSSKLVEIYQNGKYAR